MSSIFTGKSLVVISLIIYLKLLGYLPDRLRLNVYLNKIALLSVLTSLTARIAAIKNEKTGTLFYNVINSLNRV
jgi:hypothetical protein